MIKTELLLIAAKAEMLKREALTRGEHELASRAEGVIGVALDRAATASS